jgi:hypothetical protein
LYFILFQAKISTDVQFRCDVKVVSIIVRQESRFLRRTCCSISSTLGGSAVR